MPQNKRSTTFRPSSTSHKSFRSTLFNNNSINNKLISLKNFLLPVIPEPKGHWGPRRSSQIRSVGLEKRVSFSGRFSNSSKTLVPKYTPPKIMSNNRSILKTGRDPFFDPPSSPHCFIDFSPLI